MSKRSSGLWGVLRSTTIKGRGNSSHTPSSRELLRLIEDVVIVSESQRESNAGRGDHVEASRVTEALYSNIRALCFLLDMTKKEEIALEKSLGDQLVHLHRKLERLHDLYQPTASPGSSARSPPRSIFGVLGNATKKESSDQPLAIMEGIERRTARLYRGLSLLLVVRSGRFIGQLHIGMDTIRFYAIQQLNDAQEQLDEMRTALSALGNLGPWHAHKDANAYLAEPHSNERLSIPTTVAHFMEQDALRSADLRSLLSSNSSFSFSSASSHSIFSLPHPLRNSANEAKTATKHRTAIVRECVALLDVLKRLRPDFDAHSHLGASPSQSRVSQAMSRTSSAHSNTLPRPGTSLSSRTTPEELVIPAHEVAYALHLLALGLSDVGLHEHALGCAQLAVDMYWMITRKLEDGTAHLKHPLVVQAHAQAAEVTLEGDELRALEGMEFALGCGRDTLAVCHFRLGRPEDAFAVITKALAVSRRAGVPKPAVSPSAINSAPVPSDTLNAAKPVTAETKTTSTETNAATVEAMAASEEDALSVDHGPSRLIVVPRSEADQLSATTDSEASSDTTTPTLSSPGLAITSISKPTAVAPPPTHPPTTQPLVPHPAQAAHAARTPLPKSLDPALSAYLRDVLTTPQTHLALLHSACAVFRSADPSPHAPDLAWALSVLARRVQEDAGSGKVEGEVGAVVWWDRATKVYAKLVSDEGMEVGMRMVYEARRNECEKEREAAR